MSISVSGLATALQQTNPSTRLQAALTAGTYPHDDFLELVIDQCAIEPDFSVREMLTWTLTRLSHDRTVTRVIVELESTSPQARSQALHTLSKLQDARAWPAITADHLHDSDDEVARAAWRTAVGLAPADAHDGLACELKREFGRGDLDVQRSLARAMVALGSSGEHETRAATVSGAASIRVHAAATLRLIDDPGSTFFLDPTDA